MPTFPAGVYNILAVGGPGMAVTITSPTAAQVITNAEFSITWDANPIPVMFRAIITDTVADEVIYDTGYIVRSTNAFTPGLGIIPPTGSYELSLWVSSIDGDVANATVEFTTNYAHAAPTALKVTAVGMCGPGQVQDPFILPRVIIRWTMPAITPPAYMARWVILRREDDGEFIPIHIRQNSLGVDTTPYFEDATVCAGHSYSYKVEVVVSDVFLPSKVGVSDASPIVYAEFEHAFIHAVNNPFNDDLTASGSMEYGEIEFLRFESHEHDQALRLDMGTFQGAGRRLPTARFGEAKGRTYTLQGLAVSRKDRQPVESVRSLLESQVQRGAVWCLRLGRDQEKVFCSAGGYDYSVSVSTMVPSLTVTEIFYQEDLRTFDVIGFSLYGAANWREVT